MYYSAFSPIPDASRALPLRPPPLVREHRLYQADWLMRFYGFDVDEIAPPGADGMLDLDIDPKLAWALRNRERSRSTSTPRRARCCCACRAWASTPCASCWQMRRHRKLRYDDLVKLRVPMRKVAPFV